jgi:hypothetical protein
LLAILLLPDKRGIPTTEGEQARSRERQRASETKPAHSAYGCSAIYLQWRLDTSRTLLALLDTHSADVS